MGLTESKTQIMPQKPTITTLSQKDAVVALQTAEANDFFRGSLDTVNTKAREGLFYYAVDGPTIHQSVPNLAAPIQVCWMHPSAEAGMPHTRAPNLVCLPQYFSNSQIQSTLLHESIHVDQRLRPLEWVRWCVSNGWTLVDESEIPERWRKRCRMNPDTMKYRFWAYKNRWVPLPMYEREDRPRLRDIHVYWWDRKTGVLHKDVPDEIKDLVDGIQNPEHPFEIAAYKSIHV